MLQGMGFRPFIYQLANEKDLKGWVQNSTQGATIEAEGPADNLDSFLSKLKNDCPSPIYIQSLKTSFLRPIGDKAFKIKSSETSGENLSWVLPDIATCNDCLSELFDTSDRRNLYPFTNCSQCGPRYSIVESLPYDRSRTSMKQFSMCALCQKEYDSPGNRRFHAQANACPHCGPQVELWDKSGASLFAKDEALSEAIKALNAGAILAVKGLGGFHLMTDARNDGCVSQLRKRKNRDEKPFAIMYPSLKEIKQDCIVSDLEEELLVSSSSPIVLLRRSHQIKATASPLTAPGNPYLGVLLPYTPLHHILLKELNFPLIATSGNLSNETLCTNETEAIERLQSIADLFLVHNRPIVRHVDDSIVRVVAAKEQILRRARGYAPWPISLKKPLQPTLAVGGHLKNTVAVIKDKNAFISPHIGDLENLQTTNAFEKTLNSVENLFDSKPEIAACDYHPDYSSSKYAEKFKGNRLRVQHHVAHILSCMAENELEAPVLGVAWDGSGYGLDGTLWGGEFFHITNDSFHRIACFKPFPLPGGEKAIREPRRSALGLLFQLFGDAAFERPEIKTSFSKQELSILHNMLTKKINCPMTSSCGRLFDAVSAIAGIRQICNFEGQAAMDLEFLIDDTSRQESYTFECIVPNPIDLTPTIREIQESVYDLNLKTALDWSPLLIALLSDLETGVKLHTISLKFHNALVNAILTIANQIGEKRVVLSGGCFQNKVLTESAIQKLNLSSFKPYWHKRVPPNDGGLALGQLAATAWSVKGETV
jgi:hydrogenase maturation protein HypF